MLEGSSTLSEADDQLKLLMERAAGVIAGSQNTIGVTKAMELVGFSEEQRKTMKLYQKVQRLSARLNVVKKEKTKNKEEDEDAATPVPVPAVNLEPGSSSHAPSLTSTSGNNAVINTTTANLNIESGDSPISSVR
jgi:hypothetical protein